ncbi:MAG: phosphoglycerate kinase [Micavibrio sp.]
MPFKTLRDFDFKGKRVLVRADLNVPAKDGKVTDTERIDRLKPTIDYLNAEGAKIILLSHFGRPKTGYDAAYSLSFLTAPCAQSWGRNVAFAKDCTGGEANTAISSMKDGDILLLENLRFHAGEEKNDPAFVAELAALGDIYVNDAFSAAHRAHASTEGLAHRLPAAAGLLMEAELNALSNALENPQKPVIAIVGGSKISTKLSVLNNLVRKVDYLFLGGGMANTFLYANGAEIGKSLCERDMADEARAIMQTAEEAGCQIILPTDHVCVKQFGENAPFEIRGADTMDADEQAVDIGPASIEMLEDILSGCKTALWNGPMGVFEVKPFDKGTNDLARTVATLTEAGSLVSVAGGGDTVAALENAGAAESFTYISTAGGAFLEWLEGKKLPGVAALTAHKKAA